MNAARCAHRERDPGECPICFGFGTILDGPIYEMPPIGGIVPMKTCERCNGTGRLDAPGAPE